MHDTIDDDASVENSRVLIKLPTTKIIAVPGMLCAMEMAFKSTNSSASQIVMEGMGQPNRFIFKRFPASMKAAYVIRYISSEKPVFSPLDFLL